MDRDFKPPFIISQFRPLYYNFFKFTIRIFILVSFFCVANSQAQNSQISRLFNNTAVAKANQQLNEKNKKKFASFTFNEASYNENLSDSLTPDRVSDILGENVSGAEFFAQFNTPFYLHYVNDFVHSGEIDDFLSSSAAEKAFIYQSLSATVNFLKNSALEPVYRDMVKSLKIFKDYTTVKFHQDGSGRLGVVDRAKSDEEDSLFELKLHVSANNGIEPRMEIGEHLLFRYDLINQYTLMEYQANF